MNETSTRLPRIARLLGYAGLLPFAGALAGKLLGSTATQAVSVLAFITYAAIILSFIGAVHWGLVLANRTTGRGALVLACSVLPALLAWLGLLLPTQISLLSMLAGFTAVYVYERAFLWEELFPAWYRQLRGHLSVAVVVMILLMYLVST